MYRSIALIVHVSRGLSAGRLNSDSFNCSKVNVFSDTKNPAKVAWRGEDGFRMEAYVGFAAPVLADADDALGVAGVMTAYFRLTRVNGTAVELGTIERVTSTLASRGFLSARRRAICG